MSVTTTRHVAQRLWSRQLELPLHEARDADDARHKYNHRGGRVDCVRRLVVGVVAAALVAEEEETIIAYTKVCVGKRNWRVKRMEFF